MTECKDFAAPLRIRIRTSIENDAYVRRYLPQIFKAYTHAKYLRQHKSKKPKRGWPWR